ncbi:hypothetical protein MMC22_000572 [Lobaria immixta]|nr:hypothetical protein [Lobaria immixta]
MSDQASAIPYPVPPDGDQRIGNRIVVTSAVLIVPATVLIVLRLYVRTRITRATGFDDLLIVMSLLLAWVCFILTLIAVDAGEGRHLYYLSQAQALRVSMTIHVAIPLIDLATGCSRVSISLFLLRIVSPGRRWKQGIYGLIAFAATNCVAMFITDWIRCVPAEKMWNPMVPGKCWSERAHTGGNLWQGIFSVVYDFVLAILPIIFLWNVKISVRRKIGICMLMGLGSVTGASAIARTVLSVHSIGRRTDPTWDTVDEVMWAGLEANLLLIAASIPAIQPLFKRSQYRRGYVPDSGRSHRALKPASKGLSPDPNAIDYDDGYPLPNKKQLSSSGSSDISDCEMQTNVQDSAR